LRAQQSATPAVVYVDGLPKSRLRWFGVELRRLSIRTDKIVGVRREEADALILIYALRQGPGEAGSAVNHLVTPETLE
jgi:hypothetical protein